MRRTDGVEVGVDPQAAPVEQRLPRVGPEEEHGHLVGDLAVDLLEHGPEQVLLAPEVVVQRALGDAGPGHHLVDGGVRVAVRAEELPGGPDQGGPGRVALGHAAGP